MNHEKIGTYVVKEGLKHADEIAALINDSMARQVRFANNKITTTNIRDSAGLDILFKKDRRIVIGSIGCVSKDHVKAYLKKLEGATPFIPVHKDYAELPQGPFRYKPVKNIYDRRIAEIGYNAIDYVECAINSALENGAKRVAGSLASNCVQTFLFTSKGVKTSHKNTSLTLEVRAFADSEASGMGLSCGTQLKAIDAERAGKSAGVSAKMSLNPVSGKAGRYDVIFARPAAASLFNNAGMMLSAFYVDAGYSCFGEKIGRIVASDKFTMYDDGLADGGLGSRPFDDEGYPTSRKALIENGVLKAYLHNSITAKKHWAKQGGNAGWVVPRPWNLHIKAGDYSDEDLISEVKRGLWVTNATYVRFHDWRGGDFSAVIRDGVYEIENGEITRAVKGLRLDDNLLNILKNTTALSDQSIQTYHWWMEGGISVKTPLVLAKNIGFSLPAK